MVNDSLRSERLQNPNCRIQRSREIVALTFTRRWQLSTRECRLDHRKTYPYSRASQSWLSARLGFRAIAVTDQNQSFGSSPNTIHWRWKWNSFAFPRALGVSVERAKLPAPEATGSRQKKITRQSTARSTLVQRRRRVFENGDFLMVKNEQYDN